jgi:AcrR family transcriptional regulator
VYVGEDEREHMRSASSITDDRHESVPEVAPRTRDAGHTRDQLLQAARRRFAYDGYAATKVRDIATDVGVNVALINRYFGSKEGLFEACITSVGRQLDRSADAAATVDTIAASIVAQIIDSPTGEDPAQLQLLLLLRSSGDEGADQIRRNIIRTFAERMAAVAGWKAGGADGGDLILRAEIALSAALGMALLRSSTGVEPLASAGATDLEPPLRDVLNALFLPRT